MSRALKKIFFIIPLLLLVMVATEWFSRVAFESVLNKQEQENILGLTTEKSTAPYRIPNTFWHHELNPKHPIYEGLVNSHGTKGYEFDLPKPAGEFRIICLGDSTVEGIRQSIEETFPYQLELMLNEFFVPKTTYSAAKVINAGIGSHNSAFNLAYLAFRLIQFEADALVIKSTYNDYLPYITPGMKHDYTHLFPNPYHEVANFNPFWRLAKHSYFLKVLGYLLFRNEVTHLFKDYSGHFTEEDFVEMDFSVNADRFHVYAENIKSMIYLARSRGIEVYLLDLPTSPNPEHYQKDIRKPFRKIVKRLEEEVEKISLKENVPFIRSGLTEKTDFWDHCHNTVSGNKKVAAGVFAAIMSSEISQ